MRDAANRLRMLMLGCILAASDVPSPRSVLFGAIAVALAAVVVGALWKLLSYAAKSTFKSALFEVFGDEFKAINKRFDQLHECFERRLDVVEAREASALVTEVRRMADAVARTSSPARVTDPPGTSFLHERALPPSET